MASRCAGAPETIRRLMDALYHGIAHGGVDRVEVMFCRSRQGGAPMVEAAVESIASENAARFAAMESAHDNVSKKLEELRQEANQARQSEITTELIELITGAEALNNG
jgi:F-type H+-transporting ATPase subunit gamma